MSNAPRRGGGPVGVRRGDGSTTFPFAVSVLPPAEGKSVRQIPDNQTKPNESDIKDNTVNRRNRARKKQEANETTEINADECAELSRPLTSSVQVNNSNLNAMAVKGRHGSRLHAGHQRNRQKKQEIEIINQSCLAISASPSNPEMDKKEQEDMSPTTASALSGPSSSLKATAQRQTVQMQEDCDAHHIQDEIELIACMYDSLELKQKLNEHGTHLFLTVTGIPLHFVATFDFAIDKYPNESPPFPVITGGPNEHLAFQLEKILRTYIAESLDLGQPMLALIVDALITESGNIKERIEAENDAKEEQKKLYLPSDEDDERHETARQEVFRQYGIIRTDELSTIRDRKSKFVAHVAPIKKPADVYGIVDILLQDGRIASAAHPTIWAYRIADDSDVVQMDCCDDGETGADKKLTFILESHNVSGWVVIVTRWYGGIHLGPDRFKHIASVAFNTLAQAGAIKSTKKRA